MVNMTTSWTETSHNLTTLSQRGRLAVCMHSLSYFSDATLPVGPRVAPRSPSWLRGFFVRRTGSTMNSKNVKIQKHLEQDRP